MSTYIIQSNDDQQFTLSTDQINQYPLLKNTLTDIVVEPESITNIPFPADLLDIVFNNKYNESLNLAKLVGLINLVAYLGLVDKVDYFLLKLVSFFQYGSTATQIKMFRTTMNQLEPFMVRLFLDKIIGIDYDSLLIIASNASVYYKYDSFAKAKRTSANLNYTLFKGGYFNDDGDVEKDYILVNKNVVVANKIDPDIDYISNEGIFSDKLAMKIIAIQDYAGSIYDLGVSVDGAKYMYDRHKQSGIYETFVGSFAEPHKVLSFDGFDSQASPLFDTIILWHIDATYTIHYITYPKVVSTTVKRYLPDISSTLEKNSFYFSYDGKMIAEVAGNSVRILNSHGNILVEQTMHYRGDVMAITNTYLITYYHNLKYILYLWPINGFPETFSPCFKLNVIPYKNITNVTVDNVKVIVGENNSFLLTRNILYTKDDDTQKVLGLTKYKLGGYDTMDDFFDIIN